MTIDDIRSRRMADEEMLLAEFLVLLTAAHISLVLAELSLLRLEDLLVVIKLLIFCASTFASSCRPRLRSRLRRFRSIFYQRSNVLWIFRS